MAEKDKAIKKPLRDKKGRFLKGQEATGTPFWKYTN